MYFMFITAPQLCEQMSLFILEKFLKRFNLNMPDRYVKRRSIIDFERDPPITEVGRLQAKLIGKHFSHHISHHVHIGCRHYNIFLIII